MNFAEPTTDARFLYELAERLHKTVGEIVEMDACELLGWKALDAVRAHETRRAAYIAGEKAKGRPRG